MTQELPKENQIVFAVTIPAVEGDMPQVLVGVPLKAWEYMSDGKTHSFDLTSVGLPVRFIVFGGADRENILETYKIIKDRAVNNAPLDKDQLS